MGDLADVVRTADQLLCSGAPSTREDVEKSSQDEFTSIVGQYRTSIRSLHAQLQQLACGGAQTDGGADTDCPAPGPPQRADEEAAADDLDPREWQVPPHCIPIHANVTTFDWSKLYQHTQFDVIMMDPPWQLATANPTRGVALGYSQLTDADIRALPISQLQSNGLLFIWVINAKFKFTLELFEQWGYRLVDEIVWVKVTVNRRLAKSHGYYLQHAKEVCLVGQRGELGPGWGRSVASDVILSERRGQSQKPEEIYELVEQLVPHGRYLEIFARKNNLRNFWVSVGNEVTGTGPPEGDRRALQQKHCIPGAVYGRGTTVPPTSAPSAAAAARATTPDAAAVTEERPAAAADAAKMVEGWPDVPAGAL